jgi:1-acyl-sn-glycerol-3-phosphate acyltransferase
MSKIYDFPFLYNIAKRYVIFTYKRFYNEYLVIGRENIPEDGPVIFAPNHLNALMDALAVLSVVPHQMPIVFLARADIFKNKLAAKLLRFTKIMPAFRMRDGVENLGKNNDIFEQCIDILLHDKALGIMPEGNQGEQRRLRPLLKGIFRIAFAAQQKREGKSGVKIVPVGIDLGDLEKSRKHIIINIGKPIEVSEYMNSYNDNPVQATNEIREELRKRLSDLILNLDSEKYYESFETITEIANTKGLKQLQLPDNSVNRFIARQMIAEKLIKIEKDESQKAEQLHSLCTEYADKLKKIKLYTEIVEKKPHRATTLLINALLLFITFPIFTGGFMLNSLPYFAPVFIRKYVLKVKYRGFFNSLHYGIGILSFPLFYILQTILFISIVQPSWWLLLLFITFQFLSEKWALKWYSYARKYISKFRYYKLKHRKSRTLEITQQLRKKIIQILYS